MARAGQTVSLVIPMHNEASGLDALFERLRQLETRLDCTLEVICVDDGSTDATLEALAAYRDKNSRLVVVELTRNFGKEAALTAGIDIATGDAVIPIDADLQDPPELVADMIGKWRDGFDVVLARRIDRSADSFVKRATAWAFYRTHNVLSDTAIPADVGDFRLLDRSVVTALKALPERRRFMKGLFAWLGYRTAVIDYTRDPRHSDTTSWGYWRLWNLALEGFTSFSTAPLRLWTYVGAGVAMLAFLYATFIVLRTLIYGVDLPGYASLLTVVLFLGGLQLLSLGILGEYVGRIYTEAKGRPIYLIRSINGARQHDPGSH